MKWARSFWEKWFYNFHQPNILQNAFLRILYKYLEPYWICWYSLIILQFMIPDALVVLSDLCSLPYIRCLLNSNDKLLWRTTMEALGLNWFFFTIPLCDLPSKLILICWTVSVPPKDCDLYYDSTSIGPKSTNEGHIKTPT